MIIRYFKNFQLSILTIVDLLNLKGFYYNNEHNNSF